jgi:replicative DNA helicase
MTDTLRMSLPYNEYAEKALLIKILQNIDNDIMENMVSRLKPNDFYNSEYKKIYKKFYDLYNADKEFTKSNLIETMNDGSILDDTLRSLMEPSYNTDTTNTLINVIKQKSLLRVFIKKQTALIEKAYQSDNLESLTEEANQIFTQLSNMTTDQDLKQIGEDFDNFVYGLEKKVVGHIIPTYLKDLDNTIVGFKKGEFVTLAGRPGMGKSAYMSTMAKNQAQHGFKVGIYSLEMTKDTVFSRLVCDICNVDSKKIRQRDFTNDEIERIVDKRKEIRDLPIYLSDSPYTDVLKIKANVRKLHKQTGIDILYIDYLDYLLNFSDKNVNVKDQIANITKHLSQLAKELGIVVVLLSQLNRDIESRKDKTPKLSDLKNSSNIEQESDMVLFVDRPDYYTDKKYEDKECEIASIHIAKNRSGSPGKIDIEFEKKYIRFKDLSSENFDS